MLPLIAFQDVADQTIRIEIETSILSQILTWLIAGLIAGWVFGSLVPGRRMNIIGSLLIGFLGAVLGGILYNFIGIETSPALLSGITIRWIDIIVAFIGALVVLVFFGLLFGRPRRRID